MVARDDVIVLEGAGGRLSLPASALPAHPALARRLVATLAEVVAGGSAPAPPPVVVPPGPAAPRAVPPGAVVVEVFADLREATLLLERYLNERPGGPGDLVGAAGALVRRVATRWAND